MAFHAAHWALVSPAAGDQAHSEVGEGHHFHKFVEEGSYQHQPGSGPAKRVIRQSSWSDTAEKAWAAAAHGAEVRAEKVASMATAAMGSPQVLHSFGSFLRSWDVQLFHGRLRR